MRSIILATNGFNNGGGRMIAGCRVEEMKVGDAWMGDATGDPGQEDL